MYFRRNFCRKGRAPSMLGPLAAITTGLWNGTIDAAFFTFIQNVTAFFIHRLEKQLFVAIRALHFWRVFLIDFQMFFSCSGKAFADGVQLKKSEAQRTSSPFFWNSCVSKNCSFPGSKYSVSSKKSFHLSNALEYRIAVILLSGKRALKNGMQ